MASVASFFLSIVVLCLGGVQGHTYHLGDCPSVDPEPSFEMNKFLGVWYAVQKTSTANTCIRYSFTRTDEPDVYNLEQTSQHFVLGLTPLEHTYRYTGTLKVTDPSVPAKMTAKFPLNFVGSAAYTVFMTDYSNFAAIFSCQKVAFGHRRSATILSRSKTLDKIYVDKVRTRLSSYNIDPFDLSIISQKNCPKVEGGVNVDIDNDTFSAHSIAGVVRKAGEKLGDGIEYVANGAKNLYNRAKSDTSKEEIVEEGSRRLTEPEAEWLP